MINCRIKAFQKVGKEEHINSLLKEGIIYANNIDYFRQIDDQEGRGDICEGALYVVPTKEIQIMDDNRNWHPVNNESSEYDLYIIDSSKKHGHIYCLYSFFEDDLNQFAKKGELYTMYINEMLSFGEAILFIFNPNEFISRIKKKATEMGLNTVIKPIEYYTPGIYTGSLTPFHKRDEYAYQKETRIYIPNYKNQEPLIIKIGSIEDISTLIQKGDTIKFVTNNDGFTTVLKKNIKAPE